MGIGLPSSHAPTPGTRSLAALSLDVMRYVLSPDDPEAKTIAKDGINDAIREMNMRTWNWALTTQDITLVASDDTYSLANAFKTPRTANLLDSSGNRLAMLEYLDTQTFQKYLTTKSTSTGNPYAYTVRNAHEDGILTLSIKPDSGFVTTYPTLRLHYFKRIGTLTNDSDELDAPSEVENFVLWHAKSYIASVFDPKKVGYAERKAAVAWQMLVSDDNETQFADWSDCR